MAPQSVAPAPRTTRSGESARGATRRRGIASRRGSVLLEPLPSILPAAQAEPKPQRREPTDQEIRERAYQIYLERGCEPGHHLDDWIQAERELRPQAA